MKQAFTVRDMAHIALFAALIAVCSWISIPATVPFTLQTFAVFCSLCLLGGKKGFFAVLVYILLGATGLPVFAGFRGGPGVLLGTTGGYILGFLLQALLYGIAEPLFGHKAVRQIGSLVAGLFLCYAFGTAWFILLYTRSSGPVALGTALGWCVFPFILPDLAKLALAVIVSRRILKALGSKS